MWWPEICSLVWLMEMDGLLWVLIWMAWLCLSPLASSRELSIWVGSCITCSWCMGRCAIWRGWEGSWWACRCSIAPLLRVMTCICSGCCVICPSSILIGGICGLCSTMLPWVTTAMFPDDWVRRVSLEWVDSVVSPSVVVMMLISWSWDGIKLIFSTSPVTTNWISCSEWEGSWFCCRCRTLRTSWGGGVTASNGGSVVAALSLLWDLVCVFRLSKRVNERLHKEQVKGFFPEWDATWRRLALGSENDLWQMLQSYGFSPLKKINELF